MADHPNPFAPPAARCGWRFPSVWAASLLLLIAATYRLWFPVGNYPVVPSLEALTTAPQGLLRGLLWATSIGLIGGAATALVSRRLAVYGWCVVATALVASFLLDQHRLQPWAYQSLIYGLVFATLRSTTARAWLIPLAASIYLYSAAGKFDYQFAHTVGQNFLAAAAAPAGGLPAAWDEATRARLALLFPTTEFLIGLSLLLRPSRPLGGAAAMLMHLCLIAILGPWSLEHSAGVLAWNLTLAIQAYYLFLTRPASSSYLNKDSAPPTIVRRLGGLVARVAVVAAIALPLGERAGSWDHWLSWALYSPHSSRVDVELHESVATSLPRDARRFLREDVDGDGWRELALDRWSLQRLGVPVYPQARYQLSAALTLVRETEIDREIRAIVRGPADRWTGRRDEKRLIGKKELRRELRENYWLPAG